MRRLLFTLLCLSSLSACQARVPLQAANMGTLAALPPDMVNPKPKPCTTSPIHGQAILPPGTVTPKPCSCTGPRPRPFGAQAALPPDLNPNHPSFPSHPSNPNCRP